MAGIDDQVDYWNSTGVAKTFGHPVDWSWMDRIGRTARVLDYGCGYGRLGRFLSRP